jgi:hypothetical protein
MKNGIKNIVRTLPALGLLSCVLGAGVIAISVSPSVSGQTARTPASDDQAVLQANGALVRSFERDDTATVDRLLDPDFTWIDSSGVVRSKEEVLLGLPRTVASSSASSGTNAASSGKEATGKAATAAPKPASGIWSDAKVVEHVYGQTGGQTAGQPLGQVAGQAGSLASGPAGVILIARGKVHILRVWVKRSTGWRLLHINEITQLAQAPVGDAAVPSEAGVVTPCINPCKSVPFTPPTPDDQAAFSSWQQMETGSSVRDMDVWGAQVTEDCLIVDSAGSDPLSKAERMAKTLKQKQAGVLTNEAVPLLQARMFDFGDTVMMVSEHQPYGGKPYWATRLWNNRSGHYQMFISFHTTIQDVPAFALSAQLPEK